MVIALVGRRIDAPDAAAPIFPYAHVGLVRDRVHRLLSEHGVRVLVCSAACGADLIALEVAGVLGVRRRIVLPFEAAQFRKSSVVDRPGDWGHVFDRAIAEVKAASDLVELRLDWNRDESYLLANEHILEEALLLSAALGERAAAALVWNGIAREGDDMTSAFGDEARSRGLDVFEVSTL